MNKIEQASKMTNVTIEPRIELLESILEPWTIAVGQDLEGYKNHCYRMIHFTQALYPCSEEEKSKVVIASAFHDIGIWSDHTVDYLPPSKAQAIRYLQANELDDWIEEIGLMIDEHHKITSFKDNRFSLVEAFRKGDLVDFSLGCMKFDLTKSQIKQVQKQFPNAGFHKMLMKTAWKWFKKHPLSAPPFMKW